MSTVNLICTTCAKDFLYAKKEFTRQTKRGRTQFYCSLSCHRQYQNMHRPKEEQDRINIALSNRSKNNTYAKKSNFSFYLNKAKTRKFEFNIDEEYLETLWISQNERCALSGITIHLKKGRHLPNTASLDRIDSNKGYIKGNVQFLAYSINLAKNSFDDSDILSLLADIRSNTAKPSPAFSPYQRT